MRDKQLFLTNTDFNKNIVPAKNKDGGWGKPSPGTGLWTSTYDPETHDSQWVEWCIMENWYDPHTKRWFLLTPASTAKIYTIDTCADLERALKHYPGVEEKYITLMAWLDFEKMSQDYDAIHLTSHGQVETRYSTPGLNGWDVESTIWFRWCFDDVQEINPVREEKVSQKGQ